MKIQEELTLSSLKDSHHRLVEEVKTHNEVEIISQKVDTAGIQFLLFLKKTKPTLKISLTSKEVQDLAKLLGADKCL